MASFSSLRFRRVVLMLGALTGAVPAGANLQAATVEGPRAQPNEVVFSLLPKSLQRRPRLDFNVFTSLTPAGKRSPVPTPDQPVYYQLEQGMNRDVGVGPEHGIKSPPPEKLKETLRQALRESSYLEAADGHPPTLVIFFHWGTSSFNPTEFDNELAKRKTLLDRAMLLAGEPFAKEILKAMEEIDRIAAAARSAPEIAGALPNPLETLMNRSPEMSRLVEELFSSSYFVVASAFDRAALAQSRPVLLWRTKMTVNSIGVNMVESVPPLIASAAPYFGRDMETPILVSKKISRDGKVEIGEATVVEENVKLDATKSLPRTPPEKGTKR